MSKFTFSFFNYPYFDNRHYLSVTISIYLCCLVLILLSEFCFTFVCFFISDCSCIVFVFFVFQFILLNGVSRYKSRLGESRNDRKATYDPPVMPLTNTIFKLWNIYILYYSLTLTRYMENTTFLWSGSMSTFVVNRYPIL